MIKFIGLLLLMALSGCSVSIESSQLETIKNMFNGERNELLDKQWVVLFEGKYHEAYAVAANDAYTIYSLEYLELDFSSTYVSQIRIPTPIKYSITINPTSTGFNIEYSKTGEKISIICGPWRQESDLVYVQKCHTSDDFWSFQNELQVNADRQIVFIKNYYEPNKPPVELYFSQLLKALKSSPND